MGILVTIIREKEVTAPRLAELFEVSRRTINRDVESLCLAGIPLITRQGKGGGITLPEGFILEEASFPPEVIPRLAEGWNALRDLYPDQEILPPLTRLADREGGDLLSVDLKSFYGDSIITKITLIRQAMGEGRDLRFTYYGRNGREEKRIRPLRILYRWSAWYVRGYCREREEFRLYKFQRLWDPAVLPGDTPAPPPEPGEGEYRFPETIRLRALFSPEMVSLLVEEYGPRSFTESDGGLLFERGFSDYAYLRRWLLGFGDGVEVLEPEDLRRDLGETARRMEKHYFP